MHEATLAQNVLRISLRAVEGRSGRVTGVRVSVGALAGVMGDAMTFAFDAIKADTPLRDAALILEPEPVGARCDACGGEYEPKDFPYVCPVCQSRAFRIVRGEDVYVKELEIET